MLCYTSEGLLALLDRSPTARNQSTMDTLIRWLAKDASHNVSF